MSQHPVHASMSHRPPRPFALSVMIASALGLAVASSGCKKQHTTPPAGMRMVSLSRVPMQVSVPADWTKSQDNPRWLVFQPKAQDAFVAISGDRNCTVVEKRLYSELVGLGVHQVQWNTNPEEITINGLKATRAKGHAKVDLKKSNLAYVLVRAPKRRGCMVTLVMAKESAGDKYANVTKQILDSVTPSE